MHVTMTGSLAHLIPIVDVKAYLGAPQTSDPKGHALLILRDEQGGQVTLALADKAAGILIETLQAGPTPVPG